MSAKEFIKDIEKKVDRLKDCHDPESFHYTHDDLMEEILDYITRECKDIRTARLLARFALEPLGWGRERWYA